MVIACAFVKALKGFGLIYKPKLSFDLMSVS
jgi:hypothetical protein